jgi:hypothetical protein
LIDETALLSERTLLRRENSLHLDCVLCTRFLRVDATQIKLRWRNAQLAQRSIAAVPFLNDGNPLHIRPQYCRLFAAPPPAGLNSPGMQIPTGQRLFYENFAQPYIRNHRRDGVLA